MPKPSLREFQLILLDMLHDFDKFCDENGFEYYLVGGCVLGAIRHGGFIPWDDDIDVALERPQFERLETIIGQKIGEKYKYEAVEEHSIPDAPIGFLYDISSGQPLEKCPCIDIFALDGVPAGGFGRKLQHIFLQLYHISILRQVSRNRGKLAAFITGVFIKLTPNFIFTFYRKISKKIIIGWSTDKVDDWANLFGQKKYYREIMPKKYLGRPTRIKFENELFPVPEMTHEYLTRLFGDYMVLPPEDKRIPEHKDFFA